jgi:vacuolar protein sorting-associated protein 13A/C
VSVLIDGFKNEVGVCMANNQVKKSDTALSTSKGVAGKESHSFSVPIDLLRDFTAEWINSGKSIVSMIISPSLSNQSSASSYIKLSGTIDVTPSLRRLKGSNDGCVISKFDVTCRPEEETGRNVYPLVVQVLLKMTLVDDVHVYVDVCLEPRAVIENKVPVDIKIRTPMPHTFSSSSKEEVLGKDVIYILEPGNRIEVFTPGPSIALSMKTSDNPVAGTSLDWLDGVWIDLPLLPEFRLPEPIKCFLPFVSGTPDPPTRTRERGTGSEFFIAEGFESLADLAVTEDGKPRGKSPSSAVETLASPTMGSPLRTFFVTVCYYGVDHTGDILFEQAGTTSDTLGSSRRIMSTQGPSRPFSAFASTRHRRRISLLPSGKAPLRILQLTMDGDAGFKQSMVSQLI